MGWFGKSKEFGLTERTVKEDLSDADGRTLVRMSISSPKLEAGKKDPLLKNCAPFYARGAAGFGTRRQLQKFADPFGEDGGFVEIPGRFDDDFAMHFAGA